MINEPVTGLKGIGEKFADDLAAMNIYTPLDLLEYFPSRYDIYEIKPIAELIHEDKVTIEGKVISQPSLAFYGKGRSRLVFQMEVENIAVKAVIFNRSFAKNQLQSGDLVTLTGKWDAHRLQITVSHYQKGPAENNAKIQPVYPLKGRVTNIRLKKAIANAFDVVSGEINELLPPIFLQQYKLPNRYQAIGTMHFPESQLALKHARRRFIYEEFLIFQLKMQLLRKRKKEATTGNAQQYNLQQVDVFVDCLPFSLTVAQKNALEQILTDMKSPYRMSRLLQGDVGSGKTVVAAICLLASVTAGKQGALMVPTEILAEQHMHSLQHFFGEKLNITLLTGSVKGKKRKNLLLELENGKIDVLIGTHALIQDEVHFKDLGLVIVDEQHRFGVEQRRIIRQKGLHPDVLFMTATPIPRTLAITAFGDMDVSVIDEMPAGRKEIETYWVKANIFDRVLDFIKKRVNHKEQAYVICPLIEESDKLDIQDAVELHQQLQVYFANQLDVGLMHGRLSSIQKDQVMQDFAENKLQVLVSTTVVEVGVNVPNATVMVIYDAERFGLAQLHQLRGRVGRGDSQSYCILIAEPKSEVGKERMRIMTETNNGFELAEEDLQLRGPGDFFGNKQSGVPEFKVADMVHDYRALETARSDAQKILSKDLLKSPEYQFILRTLESEGVFSAKLD